MGIIDDRTDAEIQADSKIARKEFHMNILQKESEWVYQVIGTKIVQRIPYHEKYGWFSLHQDSEGFNAGNFEHTQLL